MRIITVLLATMVSCSHAPHELALSLDAVEPVIHAGAVPGFRLTLTNVSSHAIRILNAERRVDLQHTYYELVVTKEGKPVDVPRYISDPGPVSDVDWLEISPGGAKIFFLSDFPQRFEALPPGVYEACVDFWRDPYQDHATAYHSPKARFTVTK